MLKIRYNIKRHLLEKDDRHKPNTELTTSDGKIKPAPYFNHDTTFGDEGM